MPVQKTRSRHHHHVYVVELGDPVWNAARFRRANPDYKLGMPFVYVGMTGLEPEWVLHIKTLEARYAALEALILERHSYQTPEIIRLPVTGGSLGYLSWVEASCSPPAQE